MSRIEFSVLIRASLFIENRIINHMTIPLNIENQRLSIIQFEQQHQSDVICWLIEQNDFCRQEAEEIFSHILNYLKAKCSIKKTYPLTVIWQIIHKFTQQELSQITTSMGKNFNLTEAAFAELLEQVQQGNDELYEKVFLTHFDDCCHYLKRNYQASHEDAYDASMETMLEFMNRLQEGKIAYGNLRFLFTRMAGQIYWKWIKKEDKKRDLQDFQLGAPAETYDEDTLQALHKAWEGLCQDCQHLLQQFYYQGIALKSLAEQLDKPSATLRKQKQRCVEQLRKLFSQIH